MGIEYTQCVTRLCETEESCGSISTHLSKVFLIPISIQLPRERSLKSDYIFWAEVIQAFRNSSQELKLV